MGMNLNKLGDFELNKVKQDMDVDFNKNKLKPGDEGFEYDKRVDFDEIEKVDGSWDDDMISNEDDDYFEDDFL